MGGEGNFEILKKKYYNLHLLVYYIANLLFIHFLRAYHSGEICLMQSVNFNFIPQPIAFIISHVQAQLLQNLLSKKAGGRSSQLPD